MILIFLQTLISYFLIGLTFILFFIPTSIFFLMPERWRYKSRLFYWLLCAQYKTILFFTFLPIKTYGKENVPTKPAIIVANHQSSLDIPLIGSVVCGFPHIWLAKEELFKLFPLSLLIRLIAIPISVASLPKAMRSLLKAMQTVQKYRAHAMIFPEGGRYTDGKIHDFYAGFALLAKKTGRPVIPIKIFNAYKVYPPGSFLGYRYPISMVVGKPMHLLEGESDEAFKNRVHQWFCQQHER